MVDKPGRRKQEGVPWKKIAAVVLVGVVAVGAGWEIYWNYLYKAPPEYARMDTSYGPIYVELFPACAPKTVANFVSLVNSGFYSDLVWHRLVPGFVIQSGDPNTRGAVNSTRASWGTGGSNVTVPLEVTACPDLGTYAGYLTMARMGNFTTGFDTGTSQFFINLSNSTNNLNLIGYYTVFGKVISGMSAACQLATVPAYPSNVKTSFLDQQPVNASAALLNGITMIPADQAPVPQPIKSC